MNAEITFTKDDSSVPFYVRPADGSVLTTQRFDRAGPHFYKFSVVAANAGFKAMESRPADITVSTGGTGGHRCRKEDFSIKLNTPYLTSCPT